MRGVKELTMNRSDAWEAYRQYRHAFHFGKSLKEQRDMDRGLMKGYKALAEGKRVVDLHAALQAAGVNDEGYPRLAICRAHEKHCTVRMYQSGGCVFHPGENTNRRAKADTTRMPANTFPTYEFGEVGHWPEVRTHRWRNGEASFGEEATAVVPIIPAKHRPIHSLSNYHILWEAEWMKRVPVDPMLLRHLDGILYVVLASWDLTPLERAVLGGRVK